MMLRVNIVMIGVVFLMGMPFSASSECKSGHFPIRFGKNWSSIKNRLGEQKNETTISAEDLAATLRWHGESISGGKPTRMSCSEFLARFPRFAVPTSLGEWSWHGGSWEGSTFLRKCIVLGLISTAKPASTSCLEGFELIPSVAKDLPSTLGLVASTPEQVGMDESKSLPQWSPKMKFTLSDENELIGKVEDEENGYEEDHFELVAFGDFNQDGFEDVLLSVRNLSGRSYGELSLATLSRKSPTGLLSHVGFPGSH